MSFRPLKESVRPTRAPRLSQGVGATSPSDTNGSDALFLCSSEPDATAVTDAELVRAGVETFEGFSVEHRGRLAAPDVQEKTAWSTSCASRLGGHASAISALASLMRPATPGCAHALHNSQPVARV